MSDIKIDTGSYWYYKGRLDNISANLSNYNGQLNWLRLEAITKGKIANLWGANILHNPSARTGGCSTYLRLTAEQFEYVERTLAEPDRDPLNYNPEYQLEDLLRDPVGCLMTSAENAYNWACQAVEDVKNAIADMIQNPGKYWMQFAQGLWGAIEVAIGVGLCFLPGGQLAGALMIADGANNIISAAVNIVLVSKGLEGGFDFIKDAIFGGAVAGTITFITGNKELGQAVGTVGYVAYEVTGLLAPGSTVGKAVSKSPKLISKAPAFAKQLSFDATALSDAGKLTKGGQRIASISDKFGKLDTMKSAFEFGYESGSTIVTGENESPVDYTISGLKLMDAVHNL